MGATILLVDDNEDEAELLRFVLSELDYAVLTAQSADDGWAAFQEHGADALVARHHLGDSSGLELARRVKKSSPSTPVILLAADRAAKQLASVCDAAFAEPVPPILLLEALERLGLGP